MARKNFFLLLCCAIFISAGAQQLNAQTYKTGNLLKDIQLREKLFQEQKTLERESSKYKEQQFSSLEKIKVSDGQIVYRYVSAVAISPNYTIDKTILAAVTTEGLYRLNNEGNSWELVIGLRNKTINCIAFSPNYPNDNAIFVGTDGSGLFRTEDNGNTWRAILQGTTNSIAFSPNYMHDSTIYVGGRFGAQNPTRAVGYAISRDGGKTWKVFDYPPTHTPGHSDNSTYDINLSPFFDSDSIVFLSTELGYFKSTNGTRTWKQLWGSNSLFAPAPVDRINFFPTRNSTYLALAGTDIGLYQIAHEDTVWQISNPERVMLPESVSEIIFSHNYENDKSIFVSTSAGIFKSIDAGKSWSAENNGLTDPYAEAFAMSPNFENDHVLVVGTHDGVFISDTPQIEWKPRNNSLPTSFGVKNITKNPYQLDHNPRIVSSKDDAIHIFWKGMHFSPTKGELVNDTYYQKIFEGVEQVFKIPTPLEGFGWSNFEVDADRDGFVHLLLSVGDAVQSKTYYVNNRSGDFSMHVFANSDALAGDLKADKDGYAHIIGRAGSFGHLYYSNNRTGQFKKVELTNLPEHSFVYGENPNTIPNMQLDSNDNIHLFYPGSLQNFSADLYYSNNIGSDFTEFINISNANRSSGDFFVVVDRTNAPHFIYTGSFSRGQYRRLIGDSLSSPIGFSTWNIASVLIDGSDKIHLSADWGSQYITIKNDQISTVYPLKGFTLPYAFLVRGGGLAVTGEDNIHIVRSQRSNNIKSDFDFDVYLFSFKSNSNTGHIAYGYLANSDDTIPLDKDVSFRAYLRSHPDDTVTQNSVGCSYKNGNWFVQCASFASQWKPGDTLYVEFANISSGENGCVEGVLTEANTDIFQKTIIGNLAPNAFHLLFPANLDTVRADSITFKWRETTDPNPCDEVSYTLVYDTTSSFLQPVFVSNLSDTFFVLKEGLSNAKQYFWTVTAQDKANLTTASLDTFSFFIRALSTGIGDIHSLATPTTYDLHQNYPNPFNPETVIKYQLPKLSRVKLELYNLLGQKIRTLVGEEKPAGYYQVQWDGRDYLGKSVSSGIYILRLDTGEFIRNKKLMLIR